MSRPKAIKEFVDKFKSNGTPLNVLVEPPELAYYKNELFFLRARFPLRSEVHLIGTAWATPIVFGI